MKICIANSFATDGRFALIRSNDRQALAALGGLTIEVDHMSGVEPENSGDVIHVDDDHYNESERNGHLLRKN